MSKENELFWHFPPPPTHEPGERAKLRPPRDTPLTDFEIGRMSDEALVQYVLAAVDDDQLFEAKGDATARYKRLTLRLHPDKCKAARCSEAFVLIQAAYKRVNRVLWFDSSG